MRAAIFNPYMDTLGGGELYSMAVGKALLDAGYEVNIEWKDDKIKPKLENRFGMDLSGINFVDDIKRGEDYDICFWVSDGSIPFLHARKNFLHFQIPFHGIKGNTLLNKMKLFRVNKIICNSLFTKSFIDKEYGVNSVVLYPPVSTEKIKPKRKTNTILFVGRFSQLTQAKNQDVVIRAFKKFYDRGYKDWELILAGGVEVGVGSYLEKLKKLIRSYPVRIVKSPKYSELIGFYGEAKFFWSAVGFGASEEKEPEKMEHFGISVVEAMAAGTVPIIYKGGGYREIVKEGESGYFWEKESELVGKTIRLIKNPGELREVSKVARKESSHFNGKKFEEKFLALL